MVTQTQSPARHSGISLTDSLKMAVSTLAANKLRSALTMLGIVIGNATVIGMVGVGQGAQKLAAEQFSSLGPDTIFVTPGSREERNATLSLPQTLVYADAIAITEQVPSVAATAPQINGNYVITYRDKNTNDIVVGTTPEFLRVRGFEVESGRFVSDLDLERNNRVVALGSQIAEDFFGDSNPIGEKIRVGNRSFEVVGVMAEEGSFFGNSQDDRIYMPLTTMSDQLVGRTSPYGIAVTFISVAPRNKDSVRAAQFQIENLLRLRHQISGADDFSVGSQTEILGIVNTVTNGLTAMLAAIAGISLLVGGIGVMNIMLVSVTERTQEIGLRKAVGARERDILVQFLIEATILSAAGGALGTVAGVGAIVLGSAVSPFAAPVSAVAIVVAVSVSGAIGLSFGVIPARRAAKLDPIVALRSA